AWDLLRKWRNIDPDFAHFSFRQACGFPAHPDREKYGSWASKNNFSLVQLFPTIAKNIIHSLDLSVSSTWLGHQREFEDLDLFQFKIDSLQKKMPERILAGGYLEPRALYNSEAYDKIGNSGRESRTIHLGIDFWLPAQTPVHALFDGEVVTAVDNSGDKEYGGLVILKHKVDELVFYTLYGHLSVESATGNKVGDQLKAGGRIGLLGETYENGNWATHLHFQTMLSLLDYKDDFPGVAYFDQVEVWENICPDPNLLFRSDALAVPKGISNTSLIEYRKEHLGKSLSLQYEVPLKMVRGAGQYLIDQYGRKYLDTVNNVAHVGHEHYAVVRAGQEQMALINTNSRYLHENINAL
ncbi:peptidoglycan DD-metalloendopeptidase family protein, partial [Flavobacteriaceae bacterium F89]